MRAYIKEYGFEVIEPFGGPILSARDRTSATQEALSKEKFKERRKLLERELRWAKAAEELEVDYINLDITWGVTGVNEYQQGWNIGADKLYAGGLKDRVTVRPLNETQALWLYTGPLPDFARAKATRALQLFSRDQVLVVSRHREFFSVVPIPVIRISPLLVVADKVARRQLLLAAWGLEYENEEVRD